MSQVLGDWIRQASRARRPLQATLELTNRCNERCTHCYIPAFVDDPERVLSIDQWMRVLDELRSGGVLYIILMGGEAMLAPHFWDVLAGCRTRCFHTSMISNGLLINKQRADRLAEQGLRQVTFSIYSLDPEIHDSMTQVTGSHRRVMKAIDYCRDAGIQVGANCLLTGANIGQYFALSDWCEEQEIALRPDPVLTAKYNGDRSNLVLRPSTQQLREFYSEFERRHPGGMGKAGSCAADDSVCNAGKGKCAVTAYGDLLPCIEVRTPLGNLVAQNFATAWSSTSADTWREMTYGDLQAPQELKAFCDHCPGMAGHETGDPTKLSSFARQLATMRKEIYEEGSS